MARRILLFVIEDSDAAFSITGRASARSSVPKIKIVNILDYVAGGGAERAAVEVAIRLADEFECTVVSSRLGRDARDHPKYGPTIEELESAGVRFLPLGRSATVKFWEWRPLVRLLRANRGHVLHTHSYGSNFWGPALSAVGGSAALVAAEQTPFARVGGIRRWGSQAVVNRYLTGPFADAIVVPSEWSRRALVQYERVPSSKIHVIPNGARVHVPSGRTPADIRQSVGLTDADQIAIVAAMLRPEKAQHVLIQALAHLRDRFPRLQVLVAGGGTPLDPAGTRPELESLARTLDLDARVHFLGQRDDVAELVSMSDVAVLSSVHENLPLAVVEYMAAQTPIVATDVGGVSELVRDGVDALVVPPSDPIRMAEAIASTLEDSEAASKRARSAHVRQQSLFTWDHISSIVGELYREVLAGKARGDRDAASQ